MCGRFYYSPAGILEDIFEEANDRQNKLLGYSSISSGEVFPGTFLAALAPSRSGSTVAFPMFWGFASPRSSDLIINARSETVSSTALFRAPWSHNRRCLIPASFYYEWQRTGQKSKTKYAISASGSPVTYLAGIYNYTEGTPCPCCAILTRAPRDEIAFIHNRMPVIIPQELHSAWLDSSAPADEILSLNPPEVSFAPAS